MINGKNNIKIRIATVDDIENVLSLEEQLFNLYVKARPDWIDGNKRPHNYEYMKKCIEGDNGKIFIAEDDRNIIGCCITFLDDIKNHHYYVDMKNVYIESLYIDEKYRRKGIGRILFEEVKKYAKEQNCKSIELEVWEFNESAKKFYENLGMKRRTYQLEYNIE